MYLTVHNLAQNYSLLPSEVLSRASTFDLYILDLHHKYVNREQARQSGQAPPVSRSYSKDELAAMLQSAREQQ
jgi:hypothetical protein